MDKYNLTFIVSIETSVVRFKTQREWTTHGTKQFSLLHIKNGFQHLVLSIDNIIFFSEFFYGPI